MCDKKFRKEYKNKYEEYFADVDYYFLSEYETFLISFFKSYFKNKVLNILKHIKLLKTLKKNFHQNN